MSEYITRLEYGIVNAAATAEKLLIVTEDLKACFEHDMRDPKNIPRLKAAETHSYILGDYINKLLEQINKLDEAVRMIKGKEIRKERKI